MSRNNIIFSLEKQNQRIHNLLERKKKKLIVKRNKRMYRYIESTIQKRNDIAKNFLVFFDYDRKIAYYLRGSSTRRKARVIHSKRKKDRPKLRKVYSFVCLSGRIGKRNLRGSSPTTTVEEEKKKKHARKC